MKSPLQQMARGKERWGAKPRGGKYNRNKQKARKRKKYGKWGEDLKEIKLRGDTNTALKSDSWKPPEILKKKKNQNTGKMGT